ncbi:MAG: hypothetical protein ACOCSN_02720 [Halanaeroarchaeum sp.]
MVARDTSGIWTVGPVPGYVLYDLLIFAIAAAFVVGAAGAALLGHPLATGVKAGGLFAVVPTAYALFGVPPTDGRPRSEKSQ